MFYYLGIIVLWIIYTGLVFLSPEATQTVGRYGLSTNEIRILRATVVIPFLFIWLAGIYAVLRFKLYLKYVSNSQEVEGFKNITYGLWFLLIVIVLPQFVGLFITYNPDSFETQKWVTIVRNYSNIILYFLAFWFILKASKYFIQSIPGSRENKSKLLWFFMVALSTLYILLVFLNNYRGVSDNPLIRPTYYLPDVLIIFTIILPNIIIWTLGLITILNIYMFSKQVQGIVYRKAFSWVAYGLASIIGLSIILQFISQSGAYFGYAGLGAILLIVYLLLLSIAAGYLFIAKGAKALAKIEEI